MKTATQKTADNRRRTPTKQPQCPPALLQPLDTVSVTAQLAALTTTPTPALKAKWRELFGTEPPPYNRRFLESRLAYRIQELIFGGLKPQSVARLKELGKQFDGGDRASIRKRAVSDRPITGTRLIRNYQGIEHCVTVRRDDFEYQGRPYKSLSAIARAITGTRWNGLVFFGLKSQRATS
jgi:hypothetical protein